ncbi:biotin synthase BioB [Massilia sp. Root335]|uniref:biotin synthase BioB n=1 Tax=Massilia sp. Root335 TaxID=1736517 RepID=UPI0006F1D348|nr:biotin synthase BioB [Massilia sp. Root335]KQV51729.1 biotin synthase [Massilia sp. Root335]
MTQVVTLHPPVTPASLPQDATWPLADVLALFELPLPELMFRAQQAQRANFPDGDVELATLLSIKTGGCEEDCGYCPQAARYDTGVEAKKILDLDTVLDAAREAKAKGATRFCMGAAWRSPKERDMEKVEAMVRGVKALGMETCATLGMLEEGQAEQLKQAGLDYYNHNIDTSPDFYGDVISTREYRDRLDTLGRVRTAGLKICCGGIVGMGETRAQRAGLIAQLANMNPYPESVPINHLVQVEGTPMHGLPPLDPIEFVRTIAVARITMPKARVRLSAGRRELGEAVQAMCFMAGANSIFYGDKLLTTDNPEADDDRKLLEKLGLKTRSAMLESVQKESCGC